MRKTVKNVGEKSAVDRIRAFQRSSPVNKRCADCVELGPTYICMDFRTFVCQTCSGIHREFGHKIKGISLSQWTPAEAEDLEQGGGNEAAAQIWLGRWKKEECPEPSGADIDKVRTFVRQKYKEKRWWTDRPVETKKEKPAEPTTTETQKAPAVAAPAVALAPPVMPSQEPTQDLLGFSCDVPASSTRLVAPPTYPTTTYPTTAVSLFELEPAVTNTGFATNTAPTTSSLLEFDAGGSRTAQSTSTAPVDAQWTADFSSPQAVIACQPQQGGLFDIDFSGNTAPSQVDALFSVDMGASTLASTELQLSTCFASPQASNEQVLQASAPSDASADCGESPGERLRQALMSGSGSELNRLFEQSRQPVEKQPTTSAERFAALQGNLGNLFSSSQQSMGSAAPGFCPTAAAHMMHSPALSLGNQLALPAAPSMSAPSGACLWQQQAQAQPTPWWQNYGQPNSFATSSMGQQPQQLALGWQGYGQSANLPTPNAAPSTFQPPVGAPTSIPFPQMPSFSQQGGQMNNGQLGSGFMQGVMGSSFNGQSQSSNMNTSSSLGSGASAYAPPAMKTSALDEPLVNSPPKESQFGDLLAAFTEKHPINGLSVMA